MYDFDCKSLTMDDLAEIWEREFKLCWYATRYFEENPIYTSEQLRSVVFYIHDVCCFQNTALTTMIFNSYNYNTYFGNLAHGVCYKIINLLDDDTEGALLFPYVNSLFCITNWHKIDLYHFDCDRKTPLQVLEGYEKNYIDWKEHYTSTQRLAIRVLKKIVDPKYCIVTKCQSYIRGWLGRRTAKRLEMRCVLNALLYAPVGQIERTLFPSFPGGVEFNKCIERCENTAIDVHVRSILINPSY